MYIPTQTIKQINNALTDLDPILKQSWLFSSFKKGKDRLVWQGNRPAFRAHVSHHYIPQTLSFECDLQLKMRRFILISHNFPIHDNNKNKTLLKFERSWVSGLKLRKCLVSLIQVVVKRISQSWPSLNRASVFFPD